MNNENILNSFEKDEDTSKDLEKTVANIKSCWIKKINLKPTIDKKKTQ